jgi:hypothetical protein
MSTGIKQVSPEEAKALQAQSLQHSYIVRCLIAFDVLCNVVFLRGRLDETISSHSARAALEGKQWGIIISKFLDIFSKNHGAGAIIGDAARAEAIASTENKTEIVK